MSVKRASIKYIAALWISELSPSWPAGRSIEKITCVGVGIGGTPPPRLDARDDIMELLLGALTREVMTPQSRSGNRNALQGDAHPLSLTRSWTLYGT